MWRCCVPSKFSSDQRAASTAARQAYFDGEFERCLALCDAVRPSHDATRFELALLRARVYLRLDRGDRALEALRSVAFSALPADEFVAATILTGAAYVRLGQKERGESILTEASERAVHAHRTVRAEAALELGIAKFRLGKLDDCDALCASIPPEADIIHARAVEYRGWVAHARSDAGLAAQCFRAALAALASCRQRDRYVEANALYGLTALCPELLLTDEWPAIESRLRTFDWSASGVSRWRFWVCVAASMMSETAGDVRAAREWARRAGAGAESRGYHVIALCRLAAIFRGLRESNAHFEFVERALEVYDSIDVRELGADLQQLPLFVAEEVAYTKVCNEADRLVAQYRDTIGPAMKSSPGSAARYAALESTIEAVLLERRGQQARAVHTFTSAYHAFAKLGFRRRATAVALRLARLTGKTRYLTYAESSLGGCSAHFWMNRDLHEVRKGTGPAVTETEMAILRLLVQGKTYKEIAAVRQASAKTVGNHVQALFRKFAVNSRGELTAAALHHGTVSLQRYAE